MQLLRAGSLVVLLSSSIIGSALAVPTPWSEGLLDEINGLRARGFTESEIANRYPRYLSTPGVKVLHNTPQYPTTHELFPSGVDDVFIVDEDESHGRLCNLVGSLFRKLSKSGADTAPHAHQINGRLPIDYSRALRQEGL